MTIEQRMDNIENQLRQMRSGFGDFARWNGLGYPVAYSPVWTAASVNPAIGNGTLVGRYVLRGRFCKTTILLTAGSTTTFGTGAWSFSLPFTSANNGVQWIGLAHLRDSGTNNYERFVVVQANSATISVFVQLDNATNVNSISATTPFTWGAADSITIDFEYEIA